MAQRTQLNQIIELGVSHRQMNDHIVHDAVVALAQEAARARVAASAPTALTDSSGGIAASGFALAAVVTPSEATVDGVAQFIPKAGFDTATAAIDAGHGELSVKVNALLALIGGATGVAFAGTFGGTTNGTVEVITLPSKNAANPVPAATAKAELTKARNVQAALASAINYARVAMGLAPLTDGSGGLFTRTIDGWDVNDDARAATAAAASVGAQTLNETETTAALQALKNNVASMAAAVNQMRGTIDIGPFVVATSNARGRFLGGDVTV